MPQSSFSKDFCEFFGVQPADEVVKVGAVAPDWESFSGQRGIKSSHFSEKQRAVLEQMEELFESESEAAVFYEEAQIGCVPDILIKSTGKVCNQWPLLHTDAEELALAGSDAPFGRGTETVLDKNVRSCRQLNPDQFEIRNQEWNDFFSDSERSPALENIRKELAPNTSKISAQLYKMLVYPEGGFFNPHVDTLRDANMFGTLVVELPGNYIGGSLVIKHPLGSEKTFSGARKDVYRTITYSGREGPKEEWMRWEKDPPKATKCDMIAFYTDMQHEIERVQKGYRITLVYNLLRTGAPVQVPKKSFGDRVLSLYRQLFEEGMPAGFPMKQLSVVQILEHSYSLSTIKPSLLKGKDAEYYQALAESGEFDLLLMPIGIEQTGVGGCGEEENLKWADQLIGESEEIANATYRSTYLVQRRDLARESDILLSSRKAWKLGVFVLSANGSMGNKVGAALCPSGNEGTGVALLYVSAALAVKKRDPKKPFNPSKAETLSKSPSTKTGSKKKKNKAEEEEEEALSDVEPSDDEEEQPGTVVAASSSTGIGSSRPVRSTRGKRKQDYDAVLSDDDLDEEAEDEPPKKKQTKTSTPNKKAKTDDDDDDFDLPQ